MLAQHLARHLASPLARTLAGARADGVPLSPATHDYMRQLLAAGVSPDNPVPGTAVTWPTITAALDSFIVSETDAGRWSSHSRIYLPIWGLAAANAICMKTCTSGTFVNSPTHGAGFVQGNGSTSRFSYGISPAAAGITSTNGSIWSLVKQADSRSDVRSLGGARDNAVPATGETIIYQVNSTTMYSEIGRDPAWPVASLTVAARTGIFHVNRNAAQGLILSQRRLTVSRSAAATATGAISTVNFCAMALADGATFTLHSNAQLGAHGIGLGLASNASVDAFTLNLKNLWETCTGLTLP